MGYKAHDHQERRCMDCLFLKRRKTWNNSKRYYEYTNWIRTDEDDKIPFTDLNRLIVKWIIQSRSTSFNDAGILLYTVKGE